MGPETHDGVLAVQPGHKRLQGALQVAHGNPLVHHQAFNLVEHGRMGGVRLVLPVYPAGRHDADGRLHPLHDPHLHGAGLGPQQQLVPAVKVEGIAPVPGGWPS